jgi:hypothetical protein
MVHSPGGALSSRLAKVLLIAVVAAVLWYLGTADRTQSPTEEEFAFWERQLWKIRGAHHDSLDARELAALDSLGWTSKRLEFLNTFYSDERIAEYGRLLDELRVEALAREFENYEQMAMGDSIASRSTDLGVRLLYSITRFGAYTDHHLSMSHPGYLPTPYATFLASLAMVRFGLPRPDEYYVSERFVYHVSWELDESEYRNFASGNESLAVWSLEDVSGRALDVGRELVWSRR